MSSSWAEAVGADRVMDEPFQVHSVQFFPFRGVTL
jgi:hypothetical protein